MACRPARVNHKRVKTVSFLQAQAQIDLIASAIEAGDLRAADGALKALRPLLVSGRVEELQQLKTQIDAMTLVVRKQRADVGEEIAGVTKQRKAVQQYKNMEDLPLH